MPALTTDLITQATTTTRPVPTTLTAIKSIGAASLSASALTGWSTASAIHFILYNVDTSGNKVAGSQTDWKGIVSGTTITNLTLRAGTDTNYAVGTIVECAPTAAYANDLYSGFTVTHNPDGTQLANSIGATALASGAVSATKLEANVQQGWLNNYNGVALPLFSYATNNGNKEFTVTATGDLTGYLGAGTKLRIPRSVTPPTQSMAFVAASSQYATKASPTGMTDVGAFSTEGWIYLNSYAAGGHGILSRDTGTVSGFGMVITASGQIQLFWRNATVNSNFISYQSIPLKRWVHIACVATSIATPAVTMYVNGVAIPVQTVGASATTRVQGGSLQVGAVNTTQFADAFISETRYWSVAQSQAQIQANMAVNLVGNETNLVALFRGDTFNDLTANANNLTATGGATQTASYPYNPIEYGIITKASYSNPNTTLTIFTGTDYTIPNATLGTTSYSLQRTPYGFNADKGKWIVDSFYLFNSSSGTIGAGAFTWTKTQISVPLGSWVLGFRGAIRSTGAGAALNASFELNTAPSSSPAKGLTQLYAPLYNVVPGVANPDNIVVVNIFQPTTVITQTVYNIHAYTAVTAVIEIRGDFSPFTIYAECPYL